MNLTLGIIGLTNSGKTTLFNALTRGKAEVSTHLFSTMEPNIGKAPLHDERLDRLQAFYNSKKLIPADITFVDIAGLTKGASKGEGIGNQFLAHIRNTDAIVAVLRCFSDPAVPPALGEINPLGEMETLDLELILADLTVAEKAIEKREKSARVGEKVKNDDLPALKAIYEVLSEGRPARTAGLSEEEREKLKAFTFLTLKPILYVANIDEKDIGSESENLASLKEKIGKDAPLLILSAKIEAELNELSSKEAEEYSKDLGIKERSLDILVRECFTQLNLITFFTGYEKEVRAWTIPGGSTALRAAGQIHSDIERGFIRAEVIAYEELMKFPTFNAAKEKGMVRVEGKEAIIKDGDLLHIRFNV
ncbi:MAG: redox-regulated ATPase YchF [Firmicutes bacterium]|nr:redox-regulated ATPase YchF [Bacillota bacterium]